VVPSEPLPPRPCPLYPARLVGRDVESAALLARLGRGGLVTVTGPGGVGKTRLVAEVVRGSGLSSVFVDAAAATDAWALARAVLRDLRWTEPPSEDPRDDVGQALLHRGLAVVVLDNLEQLGGQAAELLDRLGVQHPTTDFVVTSRAPTHARGEHLLPLEPLPTTGSGAEHAVELFVRALPRLGALPVDPHLDRARLLAIVQALGGLPLAIELAAGRTAVLPLEEIERKLQEAPLVLLRDPARQDSRSSALRRSVEWSYDLLPPEARDILVQAAVFSGPFELLSARSVLVPRLPCDVADILQLLVSWHLLRVEIDQRMAPYEAVRTFAAEQLQQRADRDALLDRHGQCFLQLARSRSVEQLLGDSLELDAVVERGLAPGAPAPRLAVARQLIAATVGLEQLRRSARQNLALVRRLVEAGPQDHDVLPLLHWQATIESHLGLPHGPTFSRLLELATALGDGGYEAEALTGLATLAAVEQRHADTDALAARALARARASGHRETEVWLLGVTLNHTPYHEGRFDEVAERLDQAIVLARTIGDSMVDYMLHFRVAVDLSRRDFAAARAHLEEQRALQERPAQANWMRITHRLVHEAMLELGERGGEAAPRIRELARALPPDAPPVPQAILEVFGAAAERLAGEGTELGRAGALVAGLPAGRERRMMELALAALRILSREEVVLPEPFPDPGGRAVHAGVELLRELCQGRLELEGASAAFLALGPGSSWLDLVARLFEAAVVRARRQQRAWHIASDGSTFAPPGGEPVVLDARPHLMRLLVALGAAGGRGLDVSAMFEAGWPGQRAVPTAQANRVRVAVTTLRRYGLLVLAWERTRGWYLDAEVLIVPPQP
jgi:predicted ATPase